MHWKYIRKERKNGRWVYYYDDAKERQLKTNISDRENEKDQHGYLYDEFSREKIKNKNKNKRPIEAEYVNYKNGKEDKWEHHTFKNYDQALNYYQKQYNKKSKEVEKANSAYYKYKYSLKTKARKVIAKTSVKVLNTLSSARKKAKNFLKKLFG
jgi:hypothetical protein